MSQTALTFDFEIQARLRDLNIGMHLDSVECLRLIDETRMRFFMYAPLPSRPEGGGLLGGRGPGSVAHLVVGQRIEYRGELEAPPFAPLLVRMWVSRIGGSSFDVSASLYQDPTGEGGPAAQAIISAVTVSREDARPVPIPEPVRALMSQYLADPVPLRN